MKFRTIKLTLRAALAALALAFLLPSSSFAKVKVGFVYLTNPGDHGWTYAHEVGRQDVIKHFGDKVETTIVENVPEGPDATRVIRDLARQGRYHLYHIVWLHGPNIESG